MPFPVLPPLHANSGDAKRAYMQFPLHVISVFPTKCMCHLKNQKKGFHFIHISPIRWLYEASTFLLLRLSDFNGYDTSLYLDYLATGIRTSASHVTSGSRILTNTLNWHRVTSLAAAILVTFHLYGHSLELEQGKSARNMSE
jgi:hypothetical protein